MFWSTVSSQFLRLFGLPGDGINGIMETLRQRQRDIRFIQEELVAFMVCAYAKFTRRLGSVSRPRGPGEFIFLNGLYDAKVDGAPVLAITGPQTSRSGAHLYPAGRLARQAFHGRLRLQRSHHAAPAPDRRQRAPERDEMNLVLSHASRKRAW